MDESDHDYDLRQIHLMDEQLSQFEAGQIPLAHLIKGLDALLNCLQAVDQKWKEEFKGEWWTLEQVYAVALDRKKETLSSEEMNLVKGAVRALRGLVANELHSSKQ